MVGVGACYSGKFSAATSSFILKYWLKRRTAYLRHREEMQRQDKHLLDTSASWKAVRSVKTVSTETTQKTSGFFLFFKIGLKQMKWELNNG